MSMVNIIREQLLETEVPQNDYPVFSPDLNPREKLIAESLNLVVTQNFNDLRGSFEEEWDASADNKSPCEQHDTSLSSWN